MNIVLDANIFFAALIKNSGTRKIILNYDGYFLFPNYIFQEFDKYKAIIFRKSGMTETEFSKISCLLLLKVKIIYDDELLKYKTKAIDIVKDLDINDATFFACALAYPNSIIWSEDKILKNQDKVKVLNTKEIMELISNVD